MKPAERREACHPPIFEYVGPRNAGGDMEPIDHKGRRSLVGVKQVEVHTLWHVMWGADESR